MDAEDAFTGHHRTLTQIMQTPISFYIDDWQIIEDYNAVSVLLSYLLALLIN